MSDYKCYPSNTIIKIKATGEQGEAFESLFGVVSVFVGQESRPRYYDLFDIVFENSL